MKQKASRHTASRHQGTERSAGRGIAFFGLLALVVAVVASGALQLMHLRAIDLPGCGGGSGCADLAKSRWGTVPVVGVSTAGLGFAYFFAMGVVWLVFGVVRGRVARGVRAVAAVGGLTSVLFLIVMASEGKWCRYCVVAHAANFVFVAIACVGRGTGASSFQQVGAVAGLMIAVTAGVMGVESGAKATANQKREAELAESVKKLTTEPPKPAPVAESVAEMQPSEASLVPAASNALTGRFRWGPDEAAIRVVIFTDYQCPDCRIIEQQVAYVQKLGLSLSVAVRFYPFSTVCNERVPQDMHPDACFAASAALAAGTLGGTDAFWAMHQWLFERKGAFTPADLQQQASSLGLDGAAVVRIVSGKTNFDEIRSDIRLANDLGIRYTPMIFINGVEVKGFTAPQALVRAVDALAKTNPKPASADNDRPPLAAERYIADWCEAAPVTVPERLTRRWTGDASATISVAMVGDYMDPGTAEADMVARMLAGAPGSGVRYAYVNFPLSQDCNPQMTFTKFPNACLAARAASAAARVGGDDGFWRMHEWLMNNREILTPELVANGAPAIGLDAPAISSVMQGQDVKNDISEDAVAAVSVGVTSLPTIYINGKPAVSWKAGNENLLPRLVEEAKKRK